MCHGYKIKGLEEYFRKKVLVLTFVAKGRNAGVPKGSVTSFSETTRTKNRKKNYGGAFISTSSYSTNLLISSMMISS